MTLPLPANWAAGNSYTAAAQNNVEAAVNALGAGTLIIPQKVTSQASSATTVTLTSASTPIQVFTGTTQAQTVALPSTAIVNGDPIMIVNAMTGVGAASVTVNASGGGLVTTVGPGAAALFTATSATPTTAAGWLAQYAGTVVAAGKVLTVSNTITLAGTDGTTMTFPASSDTVVGVAAAQTLTSKKLSLAAGAATAAGAPLYLASGTNLTAAAAGAVEYDGTVFYKTPTANNRHVIDGEQFQTLTAAYTLTSQTAAQKLFNATTNGAVTLQPGTYFFDCIFTLSAMSGTSGSFGFALGGTATLTSQLWETEGTKAALAAVGSAQHTINTTANVGIVTATVATTGWAHVWGKVRVSAAGTVIPQVSLGVASAAIVGADSWFRIWPVGVAAVTNVGNWS